MSEVTERVGYAWLTAEEAKIQADRQTMVTNRVDGDFQVSEPCNCPAPVEPGSTDRMLNSLRERVEAIEARQRAAGIHDPDCASLRLEDALCDCWLSR
jgi:hypothetical protein